MKYFKPTNWAIEHKVPIYILAFTITVIGILSFIRIPKENMPDIVIPTIIVQTIYPGTSPTDIENLVTKPIEKQLKSVSGIKTITSQSLPDVSVVVVEFRTEITPTVAKQRVSDAVDKSKSELPNDLLKDPSVNEIDFSEFPIMSINISGDLEPTRLNDYAEELQDKIESFKEITRVDIIGAPEREFQVDVDLYKLSSNGLTFDDIERAIKFENINISGGEFVNGGIRRNVRLISQFKNVDDIKNIVIKTMMGNPVYLRDIALVKDGIKEQQSYARLNGEKVISLSVIKKSGQNLIEAADKINETVNEYSQNRLPQGVKITITNDQSIYTRTTLSDLINSVIIGFILVILVLMFFLGVQDSVFVALAVPLSSFLAFMTMPALNYTFNMVVMFSFLLSLGIIVDDAIVVIENTHRLYSKHNLEIKEAAKLAAGEVFMPVFTGTLTTLAPFFPLIFFPGIVGKFLIYLPVILIITLTASLIVAYIINPMLAAEYMHKEKDHHKKTKNLHIWSIVLVVFGILFHMVSFRIGGNILFLLVIISYLNKYFITPVLINGFQNKIQPLMMKSYRVTLDFVLKKRRPYYVVLGMIGLFFLVIFIMGIFPPKVSFMPETDPDNIYIYVKTPIGTDAVITDSITKVVEKRIINNLKDDNNVVKSVITNVGLGAGDPFMPDRSPMPHKGKLTVSFVNHEERHGVKTESFLPEFREELKDIPGVEILVDKEQSGPPAGKPVNIEISGEKLETLLEIEHKIRNVLFEKNVKGYEKLNSDLQLNKPEIIVEIDKEKANIEGLSSAQIGMAIRTAVYGREASKFRDDKDDYPIQIRIDETYRSNLDAIMNMPISFREMSTGQFRQIPISSVAKVRYDNTYPAITRKNQKRTITLSSSILTGFNTNEVNADIQKAIKTIDLPKEYEVNFTGEQESQQEASDFLGMAFLISIAIIMVILVTQFNSMSKPFIILSQVIFSTIGVFLGFIIFKLTISIVITGIGIIALIGIVVRNGIVLVDFIEQFKNEEGGRIRNVIAHGGVVRFNPVVLTAIATMLGVVPLAIGLNINFATLFDHFEPRLFVGGFSAAFWGPMAWAIIFGLSFATFLTLVIVPCLYFINHAFSVKWARRKALRKYRAEKQ
jgi:multidrug efflux pump